MVIGAAVLLFIASFLDLTSLPDCTGDFCPNVSSSNAWDRLAILMSVYLAGLIGAALVVVARTLPQPRKVADLDLGQFGVSFTVFVAWAAFWWIIDVKDAGAGLILGLIAALILAGAAVATPLVPALKEGLIPAPKPETSSPYGGQQPGTAGYGYPGGPAQQAWAGGGQPQQPYGGQQPQPGPAGGEFAPFWFAVPVARPLYPEDGSPTPIAELAPGTWYLAVDQRGAALVAQTQDGRRGVLQDTTGIQRG
jgi:hypothetical protein